MRSIVHWAENRWDRTRFAVKRRTGLLGTPIIEPYHGMQRPDGLWLRGRVMEDQGIIGAPHSDSLLTNLWQTAKRYETDEIRRAKVRWVFGGESGTVRTDREGYFDFTVPTPASLPAEPWVDIELDLLDAPGYDFAPLGAKGHVRLVSGEARYGVISDIDDTIVKTGAFNFLKHWRTVVANSAESRTAFAGVSTLYRALAAGEAGPETHPVFYVSSSPWNLFDLFDRFMTIHKIPRGPMLLKDFGLDGTKWLTGGHDGHKLTMIERIMNGCPDLSFVLIGDSGQDDGAIYAEAARRHEGRVLAVHLRDVTKGVFEDHVQTGISDLEAMGIPVTVAPTLAEAARQSAEAGLIEAADIAAVDADIAESEESDGKA